MVGFLQLDPVADPYQPLSHTYATLEGKTYLDLEVKDIAKTLWIDYSV